MKNVAITVQQLDKALNNQMMFDGSSIGALLESRNRICISIPTLIPL